MKQGTGHNSNSGRKIEPRSTAANPGGVDGLGQHMGNHTTDDGTFKPKITPLYAGRGYEAPGIKSTSRKGGSQGSY